MTKEELLKGIRALASTQGSYSRLLDRLENDEEFNTKFFEEAEAHKFNDIIDFVFWYEC